MSPEEADFYLDEWSRWVKDDNTFSLVGFKDRSPFYVEGGVLPAILPFDPERAEVTESIVTRLQGRRRYIVKLHYLDTAPVVAKAKRLRMRQEAYRKLVQGVCRVVADIMSRKNCY